MQKTIADDDGEQWPAPKLAGEGCPDPDHAATRGMVAWLGDQWFGESRGCFRVLAYLIVAPLLVLATCVTGTVVANVTRSPWITFGVVLAFLMAGYLVTVRLLSNDPSTVIARGLLRLGRCGSCKHPMMGLPSQGGRTRCGECGANWLTESIRAVHVPEADLLGARRLRRRIERLRAPMIRYRDARGRFVAVQAPRARWMRGTPLAGPARRVRWAIYAAVVLTAFAFVAFLSAGIVRANPLETPILILVGVAIVLVVGLSLGPAQIAALSKAGICPACSCELDELRRCDACGSVWCRGAAPPPLPPPPLPPPGSNASGEGAAR